MSSLCRLGKFRPLGETGDSEQLQGMAAVPPTSRALPLRRCCTELAYTSVVYVAAATYATWPLASIAGDHIITSNFQVVMWYRDEQRLFAGTYEHHLQPQGDSFLIRHKKVMLINPEAPQKTMVIYL